MNKITLTINGVDYKGNVGQTILDVASENNIYIPRLCFIKNVHQESSCRICVVEVKGQRTLKTSCSTGIAEGMVVETNNERVRKTVKQNLELIAADHRFECWACPREHNCELIALLREYDIYNNLGDDRLHYRTERIFNKSVAMVLDSGKCLLCGRCVSTCKKETGLDILTFNNRGEKTIIGPAGNKSLEEAGCIFCGKCLQACPVAAIKEKNDIPEVESILRNKNGKYLIIQAAPSVRAALGEEFGYPIGTNVEAQMYEAFELLGFDEVGDVNWGADLTIIEEGYEFINRVKNGGTLPMFTSCSPGWIRLIEQYYPEYLDNLSSCKSPNQMQGAMVKHYYLKKIGVKPEDIVIVSIMPCVAKKYEASRPEMQHNGVKDIDFVLTTRELARLIKKARIDFKSLRGIKPKGQLAQFTGAGNIFGATGGVMEAAIRTVVEVLEEKSFPEVEYHNVRGVKGIKEATLSVAGMDVNIAVVHSGSSIQEFLNHMKKSKKQYHFVEFMACSGGCVNGGGQPIVNPEITEKIDVRVRRARVLYVEDEDMKLRKSHENEAVMSVYEEFLGGPNGKKAHELLHTHYSRKEPYSK